MEIILGSKSLVKGEVVKKATGLLFPDTDFTIIHIDSEASGAEPMGEGALLKQLQISIDYLKKEKPQADYYVVMEGGVTESSAEMDEIAGVLVEDKNGQHSYSRSVSFPIPPVVAEKVKKGVPFAVAVDETYNTKDIKNTGGFVGLLTDGFVDKTALYYQSTVVAFAKFVKREWYF